MNTSKSSSATICNAVGRMLGPYYRTQLFPHWARLPDASDNAGIKSVHTPKNDDSGLRLHVIEYKDRQIPSEITVKQRLFVYVHGRARSASRSIRPRRNGSADTIDALLDFGTVLGVNLPGYEESPLTKGKLKNAEKDTMTAARDLGIFLRGRAKAMDIIVQDIVIVGVSIEMYMSLCLASHMEQASVVLIVPPADLETVPFSMRGISLRPMIPSAARQAYPSGLDVIECYKTTGFDGVKFLHQHGAKISGRLHIFTARQDRMVPHNAGERLASAFAESHSGLDHVVTRDMCDLGHEARPSRAEWEQLLREWVSFHEKASDDAA